jgi:hypothetical protein
MWGNILTCIGVHHTVTYILSVQYTCAVVLVFWLGQEIVLWREIVLKMRTLFDFLLIGFLYFRETTC